MRNACATLTTNETIKSDGNFIFKSTKIIANEIHYCKNVRSVKYFKCDEYYRRKNSLFTKYVFFKNADV